jgi:hypothetical protein
VEWEAQGKSVLFRVAGSRDTKDISHVSSILTYIFFCTSTIPIRRLVSNESGWKTLCQEVNF